MKCIGVQKISEKGLIFIPRNVKEILNCRNNESSILFYDNKGEIIIKAKPYEEVTRKFDEK